MKVKDVMTPHPLTCTPETNLAAAAALMLDADCGVLPVTKDDKLVGIVTDRDMYVALATRNVLASRLTVGDVARTQVATCGPDDDLQSALATMKQRRVRRLPVEGFGGTVVGLLSMNDIVRALGAGRDVRGDDVLDTLQSICARRHPTPHVTAA